MDDVMLMAASLDLFTIVPLALKRSGACNALRRARFATRHIASLLGHTVAAASASYTGSGSRFAPLPNLERRAYDFPWSAGCDAAGAVAQQSDTRTIDERARIDSKSLAWYRCN